MYRDSVGVKLCVKTLEADERWFGLRFVGAVNFRMREGESDHVHIVGRGSRGWVG